MKKPTVKPVGWRVISIFRLAAAAADRCVVHHYAAGAAIFQHAAHAITARLNHLTALGIAARAGDRDALLGHVAFTHAHD